MAEIETLPAKSEILVTAFLMRVVLTSSRMAKGGQFRGSASPNIKKIRMFREYLFYCCKMEIVVFFFFKLRLFLS